MRRLSLRLSFVTLLLCLGGLLIGDTENVQRVPLERVPQAKTGTLLNDPFPTSTGGVVDPLWDGLVAGWNLDEESGGSVGVVRADVLGTYGLTDNNTTPSAAGLIGNAASFTTANSESLTNASFAPLPEYTVSLWFKTTVDVSLGSLINLFNTWSSKINISVVTNNATSIGARVSDGTTAVLAAAANDNNDGSWHLVTVWYDSSTKKISVSVDDGTPAVSSALTGTIDLTADTLYIGGCKSTLAYFTGQIDEVYIWSRVLTSDERTALYNSGAGRAYPN